MSESSGCIVCGIPTQVREGGLDFCYEHAAVARRLVQVVDAKTPFDLVATLAQGARNDPDGRATTYQIAPDKDVERAVRDVDVTIMNVPVFAVEALYDRLFNEVGRPDVNHADVTLEVSFESLDEADFARLNSFTEKLWMSAHFDVTKVRLYSPEHLASEKLRQVDEAASKKREQTEL